MIAHVIPLAEAARQHGMLLHPTGRPGRVAIGRRDPTAESGWSEETFTVTQLTGALADYAGAENVYISMQRFRGWRRIANLQELGAIFSDIDFYKIPELAGKDPSYAAEYVLAALEGAGIPAPSLVIATGRGLVLVWLHSPVPRAALPRWNAVQKVIFKTLRQFGADPAAKDAARVLRLAGTIHGSSGNMVEIIGGDMAVWSFDDLAHEILPYDREQLAELYDMRVQRVMRRKPPKGSQEPSRSHQHPQGWTGASLWEARLTDLQTLRVIRFGAGKPMEDYRNRWLFLAGVAISWITYPPMLKRELLALAVEIGYSESEARSKMQAVFDRSEGAARGEKIIFAGREWDPRYHHKNETIRERKEVKRRKDGLLTRAQYEATVDKRRLQAGQLRAQGLKQREIAEIIGCTQQEVSRLLKPIDKAIQQSVSLNSGVASPEGGLEDQRPESQQSPEVATEIGEEKENHHPPATETVQGQGGVVSDSAQVVKLPFIDSTSEFFAPVVEQVEPEQEPIRNLPPISKDGIYEHGPNCRCGFFCDEDAPEYIRADEAEVAGAA